MTVDPDHVMKYEARAVTAAAIKAGVLVRPDACDECGARNCGIEVHHLDYRQPLEVSWLCGPCHGRKHGRKRQPIPLVKPPRRTGLIGERAAQRPVTPEMERAVERLVRDAVEQGFPEKVTDAAALAAIAAALQEGTGG